MQRGDEETRGAEAALQPVAVGERLLQRVQFAGTGGQALHRGQGGPVGLHGQHEAGPDRLAVQQHGARPADALLAAQVSAGEPEVVAERIGQRAPGLHVDLLAVTVDAEAHLHGSSLLGGLGPGGLGQRAGDQDPGQLPPVAGGGVDVGGGLDFAGRGLGRLADPRGAQRTAGQDGFGGGRADRGRRDAAESEPQAAVHFGGRDHD